MKQIQAYAIAITLLIFTSITAHARPLVDTTWLKKNLQKSMLGMLQKLHTLPGGQLKHQSREEVVLCSIIRPSFGQMNSVKATRILTKISHGPSLAAGFDSKAAEWQMLVGNLIIDCSYPLLMAWGLQTCLDLAILTSVAMGPSRDCLSYIF